MYEFQYKKSLVVGVGVNDITRSIVWRENGKRVLCPIYRIWHNMLSRCYNTKFQEKHPSYKGCYVVDDWLYLSKFENWLLTQDWEGKQLDKDILIPGNRVYGPDTCIFVEAKLNTFLLDVAARRGLFPCGVSLFKRDNVYESRCSNPFSGKKEHLGRFDTPEAAHLAWKAKKHQHALVYADAQTDPRVAEALRTRYL